MDIKILNTFLKKVFSTLMSLAEFPILVFILGLIVVVQLGKFWFSEEAWDSNNQIDWKNYPKRLHIPIVNMWEFFK